MTALLNLLLWAAAKKKPAAGIVKRSSTTSSGAVSSSSWSVAKPAGAAVGDYVLLAMALNDSTAPGAVTGFTQLSQLTSTADAGILTLWGRVLDGSEGSTFGGTLTSTGFNNWAAEAICYSGVSTTTPTDGLTTLLNSTPQGSPKAMTIPAITTTIANDMLVAFYSLDVTSSNSGNPSYTAPTGFTAVAAIISPRQVADIASFQEILAVAGSSGTVTSTVTFPANGAGLMGIMVALRPV